MDVKIDVKPEQCLLNHRTDSKKQTGLSIEISTLRPIVVRDKGLEPLRSPART